MRPCTAGQKRFSFRISQMTQLTADSFKHYDTHDELAKVHLMARQKPPCAPERLFCGWARHDSSPRLFQFGCRSRFEPTDLLRRAILELVGCGKRDFIGFARHQY